MDAMTAARTVDRLYSRLIGRRGDIRRAEDYHEGRQPLSFATEEWRKANAARYTGFSDNWCGAVVSAEAERILHTGVKLGDGYEAASKELWEQWLLNEMEMQSSQGFVTSLTAKRSYVLVWGDSNDDSLITWEHPSSVEIEYDWGNRRKRTAAIKTWADTEMEYATLYLPEAVYKFQRARMANGNEQQSQKKQAEVGAATSGGWVPRLSSNEVWPLPNPMGEVPIVEVPNRPNLSRDPLSEIQGVMPMQDAINLLWAYMFLAADYASMDARIILGTAPPKVPILDANGQKTGERPVDMKDLQEKRFLYLADKDAKIDSWKAAELAQFGDIIELAVGHIAAQTRTPPTYLVTKTGMSNVNGEGLKASEIGLVKKTLEFQTFASPAIRDVYRLIALAKGDEKLARLARLGTMAWANPEIRSEAQLADALLKKKQMGYPLEYLMEIDGLDPAEVERVLAMREAELRDPQIEAAARALAPGGDVQPVPEQEPAGGGPGRG
jgi:hypothetical protein